MKGELEPETPRTRRRADGVRLIITHALDKFLYYTPDPVEMGDFEEPITSEPNKLPPDA